MRPLPAPRGAEPLEGFGGRGAPPWGRGTLCHAAPGCSAGARRSPGTRGLVVGMGLGRLTRCVTRRHGGVAAAVELLAARYQREKRKKTKRNERKRKKTKQKNKWCTVALSTQSLHRRGSVLPLGPDPPGPGARGPAGPDPASATEGAFTRARALRTGCGERGWAADWPVAGGSARAPAECTGVAGAAERVGYMYAARLRPVRNGRATVRSRRRAGRRRRTSAPRPRRPEALAGQCGRRAAVLGGGEAGSAGPHVLALPGPGRSVCGQGPAGRTGGPYLPTLA